MRIVLLALVLFACDGNTTDATNTVGPTCTEGCKSRELTPCTTSCEQACGDDLQCFDTCARDCQIAYDTCVSEECS